MNLIKKLIRKFVYFKVKFFGGNVTLGRYSYLNIGCEARGVVKIGNYCAIGRHVIFQGRDHIYSKASLQNIFYKEFFESDLGYDSDSIEIGNDVWIANRVTVLPGVNVGDGAILASGAVVNKDVKPFEIVGGVPAEHIGWRFSKSTRNQLLEINWWDWPGEKIKDNFQFFNTDLSNYSGDLKELIN